MSESANPQQAQAKVLRIGIIQGDRIVSERLIKPGQSVTIGQDPKSTFVVAAEGVPKKVPMFVARVVLAAGSAYDGDRPGLAALVGNLLGEGTVELAADEFHERLESTGARIGTGAAMDHAYISLRSASSPVAKRRLSMALRLSWLFSRSGRSTVIFQ